MSKKEFEHGFLQGDNFTREAKAHCWDVDVLDQGTRRSLQSKEQSGWSEIAESGRI